MFLLPLFNVKVFSGQTIHSRSCPVDGLYVSNGQFVQLPALKSKYVPDGQFSKRE